MTETQITVQYFRLSCETVKRWINSCRTQEQLELTIEAKRDFIDKRFSNYIRTIDDTILELSVYDCIKLMEKMVVTECKPPMHEIGN